MATRLTLTLGDLLFSFNSFDDWVNHAKQKFASAQVHDRDVLCIDGESRVCDTGKEFMRARDENTFPVRAFRKVI